MKTLQSFEAFWPYYLSQHLHPLNRALHYAGTSAFLALVVVAAVTLNAWLVPCWALAGYGFAWFGHFVVERNRPATFTYPVWSFLGDLRMYALWLTGRLAPHLDVARAAYPAAVSGSVVRTT